MRVLIQHPNNSADYWECRIVSLQSSLADAQNLLDQAVEICDDLLAEDKCSLLVLNPS